MTLRQSRKCGEGLTDPDRMTELAEVEEAMAHHVVWVDSRVGMEVMEMEESLALMEALGAMVVTAVVVPDLVEEVVAEEDGEAEEELVMVATEVVAMGVAVEEVVPRQDLTMSAQLAITYT